MGYLWLYCVYVCSPSVIQLYLLCSEKALFAIVLLTDGFIVNLLLCSNLVLMKLTIAKKIVTTLDLEANAARQWVECNLQMYVQLAKLLFRYHVNFITL